MLARAAKGGLGSEVRGALAAEPAFDCGTRACAGTERQLSCKCENICIGHSTVIEKHRAQATEVVRKIVHGLI
jgi:hypothetical protein